MAKHKKLTSALKVIVSIALIYFIFTKIDLQQVGTVLKGIHLGYLFLAIVLFTGSKVLSAVRVNLYFHEIGIKLKQLANLKLALLGMFYNLFLPGGIGGDAYKGYLLNKEFDVKTKRIVSVLVLDRLSGLLLLFIYASALALILNNEILTPYRWPIGAGIIASVLIFWLLNKKYFDYVLPVFWRSVLISALVQLCQLISVL
ncbi:MAG: lysylphosphatidylglycerol synthase transmembrane domain-containing protein [Aurantibacter sp.]